VLVEVHEHALGRVGRGEQAWNPDSRETADHSIPYLVAVTLLDGTVTMRSFDEAHLRNPELRRLMQKIKVVANADFTRAFEGIPRVNRTRVTVLMERGERIIGESGGEGDDMAAQKSDQQIVGKFRGLTEDVLGTHRVAAVLDRLWHLDEVSDVAVIPGDFVLI
jgi:2-methylcitrate dehydratase